MYDHNIICLEGEWKYTDSQPRDNRFDLDTKALLTWLKQFYNCDVIHRHVVNREALEYYMEHFSKKEYRRAKSNYDIVYISCHGWNGSIQLEGENGNIDLDELAYISERCGCFFKDRIVHFSSCKTMVDKARMQEFKTRTEARLVCGYSKSVSATKSSIADIALFNELMNLTKVGVIANKNHSRFWTSYGSILRELGFKAY